MNSPSLHSLAAAALLTVAALAPHPAAAQSTATPIRNIVLVHGAWADGSSWSRIVPLLQKDGFHVICVQNPLTSIADDVAATNRIIDAQDGPVLLVGHSYGGVVITEAGTNPKVVGLVYVAAFAPDAGETAASLGKPFGPTPIFGELNPLADGFLLLTSKGVAEDFAQDLSPEEKSTLFAVQGATQGAVLQTPLKIAAWHTKPSWFVISANDRAISPEQERFTARRMGARVLVLPTSHVPMLSRPKEVSDFIAQAAATGGSPSATR